MSSSTENTDSKLYPLLSTVNSPADLRLLNKNQLPQLCSELRSFLINSLCDNPGHFASSMGAVELTVALHYVFSTPNDRIVWDVGHQAYPHKIITGRRDRFKENRKLNGLSGFPNPDESPYDTFTAGHASNSISAALGMAVASQLSRDNRHVIAVIGDAAIAGGLAFEGLNNAANTPNNLLIILNDNDMSIDKAQGSLNTYLAKLTASKGYNKLRHGAWKGLRRMKLISESGKGAITRLNNSLKSFLNRRQNIFEGLNIRYFGPFDGHDVNRLIKVLNTIKDMKGPKILHLCTVKGQGYAPAEEDPATWHAPGRFNPETGELIHSSSTLPKYQDIFGKTLLELARADKRIVGITAAMPSGTSLNIMNEEFPERSFDVGISEGHAVTFAGGLAKEGMHPFVAIYSSFLQRAFDNIIHDTAIASLPVVYCIDRAGIVGEDGVTHHGSYDLAYMSAIPGMTISAPSSGTMLTDLMKIAAESDIKGPWAIRYPRGTAAPLSDGVSYQPPTPGKANRVISHDQPDVVLLSIGIMLNTAIEAARILQNEGIKADVVDMVWLKPIDKSIIESVSISGAPIITLEDGTVEGGLGSMVSSLLTARGNANRVARVGIPDSFIAQGTVKELHKLCNMDAQSVVDLAKNLVRDNKNSTNGK